MLFRSPVRILWRANQERFGSGAGPKAGGMGYPGTGVPAGEGGTGLAGLTGLVMTGSFEIGEEGAERDAVALVLV